jgi:membrane protease YdiL (CAAX protease family)
MHMSSPALTAALPARSTRRSYWTDSREARYSLTFALPLLALYELLAAALARQTHGVRNGADVLLRSLFEAVLGTRGPIVFGVVLLGAFFWLIVRDARRHPGGLRSTVFVGMLIESVVLAGVFGVVVGLLTAQLVAPLQRLAVGGLAGVGWPATLMVSLGAGLYEELLFRVLLVGSLVWLSKKVLGWGPVASGLFATIAGALVFSAFHYIGPYGDRVQLASFVFRAIAGVAFSALYILRGFGITAWTHALYDVMLLVVRGA